MLGGTSRDRTLVVGRPYVRRAGRRPARRSEESHALMDHPTDLDLAEFVDRQLDNVATEAIRRHLDACGLCRALLADMDPANWSTNLPTLVAPSAPLALAVGFTQPAGEPHPGELWRLEWQHDAALALVLEVEGERVRVVPAVVEPISTGTAAVLISAEDSPLLVAVEAWATLVTWVPIGAFHVSFGEVASLALARLQRAAGMRRPTLSSIDAAIPEYVNLAAVVGRLAHARWTDDDVADPIDLRARAQEVGVSVATLSETLGLTPSDVTELFRGHKVPTDDQVDVLARVLDVDPRRFSRAPSIPEDMAQAIERPGWRPHLQKRAHRFGISEAAARRQLAAELLPVAARTTGHSRGRPDWTQLIAEALGDDD